MEDIECKKCGKIDSYPAGYLTEAAMKEYKCAACRQVIVELAAEELAKGNRRLLID